MQAKLAVCSSPYDATATPNLDLHKMQQNAEIQCQNALTTTSSAMANTIRVKVKIAAQKASFAGHASVKSKSQPEDSKAATAALLFL